MTDSNPRLPFATAIIPANESNQFRNNQTIEIPRTSEQKTSVADPGEGLVEGEAAFPKMKAAMQAKAATTVMKTRSAFSANNDDKLNSDFLPFAEEPAKPSTSPK